MTVPNRPPTARTTEQLMSTTLADEWKSFREGVIPKGAPTVQIVEMRRAFYAGAAALLAVFWAIGARDVPEDEGVKKLTAWSRELDEFATALKQGRA